MNRGKTKNFYKDTQFHLKTNLLLEKTFRIQPAEREQKEAKNPSTSNSQTLPSRLIPIQFHSFQKKKKKRRERDSIKFSYRSRRSSGHARRFIATCGRNPLGISRYSRGKMWSKTGHENSLAAENMGNDIVNEARTRQQKPPSSPAKTNKIGRFQHRRRQE